MFQCFKKRIAATAMAIALISPTAAAAATVDLFATATPSDRAAAAAVATGKPGGRGVARERTAAVTTAAAAGLAALRPGGEDTIRVELFPGVTAIFLVSSAEPAAAGGALIGARMGEDDDATLVVSNGKITGRVRLKGKTYLIRPAGGRLHAVTEIDPATVPDHGPEIVAPRAQKGGGPGQPSAPATTASRARDGVATIDVMFVYTEKAKAASGDIASEISAAVAITNEAYRASGVKMRMRLVRRQMVKAYDEDAREYETVLADLAGHGPDAASFARVRRVRDQVGADFVVLLREGGGYCGIGYVILDPVGADAWTYTTASRGICVAVDTVAHEVGHNMGLRHDRYVTKDEDGAEFPPTQYNFGYVSLPARAMDIMAYENRCSDAGLACQYKRLFSSPKLKVGGVKFGVAEGKPGAADAVRWLNEIRWIAQDLRPSGGTKGASAEVASSGAR